MNRKEEKTKKKINIKNKKGITLIALVITIIVLLILAGVSIAMLTGENGILTQASNAKREQEYSSVVEGIKLAVNEYITEKETGETTQSFIDWLKAEEREYINDANEIQVSNLLGQSLSTGKGSGQKDVYKLEEVTETAKLASIEKVAAMEVETNKKYEVVYYGEDETRTSIETIQVATTEALQETDPSLFEVDDEGTITLKNFGDYYNGTKEWTIENVVIPSEINGKKVTKIGARLFSAQDNNHSSFYTIKSIVIPKGVTEIVIDGNYGGFQNCIGLEKIKIPSSLTKIDFSFIFNGCDNLKEIEIDGDNQVFSSEGGIVFDKNKTQIGFIPSAIEKLTIPDTVTELKTYFYNLYKLKEIYVEENNQIYSSEAGILYNKDKTEILFVPRLKEEVDISNSVISITEGAFAGCNVISNITIPSTVAEMGDSVFYDWTEEQKIYVPFNKGEKPEGWDNDWLGGCNATIVYANGEEESANQVN